MPKGLTGSSGVGKTVRRVFTFLLACLFAVLCIPCAQEAEAGDPASGDVYYEWILIRSQEDIPEAGSYPMLLCYTDTDGVGWFLTGHSYGDGNTEKRTLYRNGIREKQNGLGDDVRSRYQRWLGENALRDSDEALQRYLDSHPDEKIRKAQNGCEPFENTLPAYFMSAARTSGCPEIDMGADSFYTVEPPSDWELIVTGETEQALKTVQIRSGDRYLEDGVGDYTMAQIEWDDEGDDYCVYTKDAGTDRADYTLDGCVQLFYYDSKGYDTGLCWDHGYFGGIEGNDAFYSSFRLYYGVQKTRLVTSSKQNYEWRLIRKQSDIPAKGEYPMLLCYTDLNGVNWFLTGHKIGDGKNEKRELCRNGISSKKSGMPNDVKQRYQEWLKATGSTDDFFSKSTYLAENPEDYILTAQYGCEPLISGHDTYFMTAVKMSAYPQIAVGSDRFYTETLPGDWRMVVTGRSQSGMKKIRIRSGDQYLEDDTGTLGMAQIDWEDEGDDYCVYTKDVGGSRADYTLDGSVQIFYYDSWYDSFGGNNTGLCWDYGYFGGIEENDDFYSNFRLYYAIPKDFDVIDRDYTVPAGSVLYAANDLEVLPGVELTIEPGGILSVTGTFLNNGVIHNCGTMILQKGSTVTTMEPKNSDCGQLNCYGSASAPKGIQGDCQGDLIILEGASLIFCNKADSMLNLLSGSTCVNSGSIVAPYGIGVLGGELINRPDGHVFIGYYFEHASGSNGKLSLHNAGTAQATLSGLSLQPHKKAVLDLRDGCHVRNDGTLLLNGVLCRRAAELEPGSRFYDRNSGENARYYSW